MNYIKNYLDEVKEVVDLIEPNDVYRIVELLVELRERKAGFSCWGWGKRCECLAYGE